MEDSTPPIRQDLLDVLCYLLASARTQLDEAAEYAPLRLLTAAERLATAMEPHADPALRPVLHAVRAGVSDTSVAEADPAAYAEGIDALCRTVAQHLLDTAGRRAGAGR
ncbi:DUF6092 family protein [Streptomyces tropicalis]|uniref:DUF6092 family protein n=1 Tax=Streptomyces tropicalis TaxID=3034234 RepID=A0ABT6A9U6_9ACTN|nr:DUF6092 family protein [Streptomyces tropicalis]MDF3301404.1 DUF6092 family protein [Streptomyces tropicalis]